MVRLGLAGPALVVAGRAARTRLADVWRQLLATVGIPFDVIDFGGECSSSEIARITATARQRDNHRRGRRQGP